MIDNVFAQKHIHNEELNDSLTESEIEC
jgi:hypothetical protein